MSTNTTNTGGKDCGCGSESTYETQVKTINRLRDDYCKELFGLRGEVVQLEVRKQKLDELIADRQCWFVWNERHYRIFRNMELQEDLELLQVSDSIKEGVKNYVTSNKNLAEALKKLAKTVKDIRTKTIEFQEAAAKLDRCREDVCNCAQMTELTGVPTGNCKGDNSGKTENRDPNCKPEIIIKILDSLVCMPKFLAYDADSLFKSSSDVVGIQAFSNVGGIDALQAELADRIKKFDKQVTDVKKRSETDLKTALDELGKSKKEMAKTKVELYGKRTDFEGVKDAVAFYCCPDCECIKESDKDCDKRLECCEKKICDLCKDGATTPAQTAAAQ